MVHSTGHTLEIALADAALHAHWQVEDSSNLMCCLQAAQKRAGGKCG